MRSARSLARASFLLSLGSLVAASCSSSSTQTSSATAALSASSASAAPSSFGNDDRPRSVYPVDKAVPANPLAEKLCAAVHGPERRSAECCKSPAAGKPVGLEGECVRTLSMSISAKATTVDEAEIAKCAQAIDTAFAGCDWVGELGHTMPAECQGLIHGTLEAGGACRSSLECGKGLRCLGGGPLDVGKCGPPRNDGSPCDLANDVLASYARQDHIENEHPECAGVCGKRRCAPRAHEGEVCTFETQCDGGSRCVEGHCKKSAFPAVGEACESTCAGDARCLKNKCVARRPSGEACSTDLECKGACLRDAGAENGKCGMRCGSPPLSIPVPKK